MGRRFSPRPPPAAPLSLRPPLQSVATRQPYSAAAADPKLGLRRRSSILRSAAADPPVGNRLPILHSAAAAAGEALTTKPVMQVTDMEWSPGTNISTALEGMILDLSK